MFKPPKTLSAAVLFLGAALPALAQDPDVWDAPKLHLALSGGFSKFRLPDGGGGTGPIPGFDPRDSARTAGAALSLGIVDHLGIEAAVHATWGDSFTDDDVVFDDPRTWTGTLGLRSPWPMANGRLVPYVGFGVGIYRRDVDDAFERTLANSLNVPTTDPLGFVGGGIEWRLTRHFGIRGDYRYLRVFPDDEDIELDRERFNIHRFTGGVTIGF